MTLTPLSRVLSPRQVEESESHFEVGEDWLQGRSVFGGLQVALMLAAMRRDVPDLPLRALQVAFMAPVPAGVVRVHAQRLRAGRHVVHAEAWISGAEGERLAQVVGVFGSGRASGVQRAPVRPEVLLPHPLPLELPWIPGATPAFTRHFRARWLEGALPFTGKGSGRTVVEMDLLDDAPCSEAHLVALADFVPPVALGQFRAPTPGSSLTWLLECCLPTLEGLPLQGWRVDSEMLAAAEGYTHQHNRIWTPDGRLAALSQQTMVVFG